MFGSKKKLYREGEQTQGQIVQRSDTESGFNYHVKVRVKFPDGSTTEIKKWLNRNDNGQLFVGSLIPVRYDPSSKKAVVDMPALEGQKAEANAAGQAALDAQFANLGEARAGAGAGAGGGQAAQLLAGLGLGNLEELKANPEDRLAKLAKLKEQGMLSDEEFAAAKAKILGP